MTQRSIVCATSLAGGREAFSTLGRVTMVPEAEITAGMIRDADMLFTRSKVHVTDKLLDGCRLKFYGTATAGTDHVDVAALERRGIAWAAAPGSNANSVAEYVIASLAWLGRRDKINWAGKTIAIIGAGHVGARLSLLASALGLHVRLNDPPLRESTGEARYENLHDILKLADVVSLHVPLTDTGKYPTRGMVDESFLANLKPGAVFINASRGEVVRNEKILADLRRDGGLSALLLDVFLNEPDVSPQLIGAADLATPHIAGYSLDARIKGTGMVYRAACRHVGIEPSWTEQNQKAATSGINLDGELDLHRVILAAYDPAADDQRFRHCPPGTSMAMHFRWLRENYPERREFNRYRLASSCRTPPAIATQLTHLGFNN